MFVVSDVFYSNIAGEERLKTVRIQNSETGEENLLERHELIDPRNTEVGDEYAYKVSLLSEKLFDKFGTNQYYNAEWKF